MIFEKVTVVISATDEYNSLIETVETTMKSSCVSDIAVFMIVIPKTATKDCLSAIDYLQNKYPDKIQKVIQKQPYIGGAVRASIEETHTSHIMFFSADIPVSLETIPLMIQKGKENPETIVKISRWLEKNCFYGYNKKRKHFNYIAQSFLRILFKSNLTDFTSPILIAPTKIYKNISFKELNFPCLLEMVLLPLKMNYTFIEVPTKCYARKEGKSKNSILQTFLYFKVALRIKFTP